MNHSQINQKRAFRKQIVDVDFNTKQFHTQIWHFTHGFHWKNPICMCYNALADFSTDVRHGPHIYNETHRQWLRLPWKPPTFCFPLSFFLRTKAANYSIGLWAGLMCVYVGVCAYVRGLHNSSLTHTCHRQEPQPDPIMLSFLSLFFFH